MKDLKKLLYRYKCAYEFEEGIAGQLNVRPSGHGLPMTIYGSFAKDNIDSCELYSVQVEGFSEDIADDELDEDRTYAIAVALLEGNYYYELKQKNLRDRLFGGSVYLTIGKNIVNDFYCYEQKKLRKLLRQGELKSESYDKR